MFMGVAGSYLHCISCLFRRHAIAIVRACMTQPGQGAACSAQWQAKADSVVSGHASRISATNTKMGNSAMSKWIERLRKGE